MSETIKLTITSPTEAYTHHVENGTARIGRSTKCEFNIPKEDLSREHCLFEIINGEFFVTDLESKNGVWVDRVRIPPLKKTRVTFESAIGFSNLYTMKINAFEIKTKIDLLRPVDREKETVTFQFDLEDSKIEYVEETPPPRPKKVRTRVTPSPVKKESTQMVVGFVVILALALLYQAFGV